MSEDDKSKSPEPDLSEFVGNCAKCSEYGRIENNHCASCNEDLNQPKKVCTCGSEKTGGGGHSSWCDL